MSATFIRDGETISVLNGGGAAIEYKDVIDLGSRIAVAAEKIAVGATGRAAVEGVFELPAIDTAAFTQGEVVYWDAGASKLTNEGAENTRAGWCVAAKLQAGTTAQIKID